MATEHHAAQLSDLHEDEMTSVEVGETAVLLTRTGDRVHAVGAHCTHYGAPLADGALADGRVICPWHHACFDVRSGEQLEPPGLDALPRFEVRVDGDDVFVTIPDDTRAQQEPARSSPSERDARVFVVLGGGIAGENAVETLRAEGFGGRVVMVSREDRWPYNRTDLSKSLEAAEDEDGLRLRGDAFYEERAIERRTGEATRVDTAARRIEFADGEPLAYDALLVATGSAPRRLDLPGAELDGVHTLRTPEDARRILAAARAGQRAVLVGSSFIALELAGALAQFDVEVTVVAPEEVPFAAILGERVGRKIRANHEAQGTRFRLGRKPAAFEAAGEGGALRVRLDDDSGLDADLVVLGVGVRPVTDLVEGIERSDDGGIVVDASLQAADGVWAAGDVASFPLPRGGGRTRIEHWRLAAQHGRVAARAMLGREARYEGVPFFWSAQPDLKLRYVGHIGHAEGFDEVVHAGDVEAGEFIAYYVVGGEVRAAAGAGRDRELAAFEHLLRRNAAPSPDEVRAGVAPLERL